MPAKKWLEKHHKLKLGEYSLLWVKIMNEWGKYCAEIAFDDGFNMGFIDCQRPSFDVVVRI